VIEIALEIKNESGMHLRACSAFVKLSSRFRSRITLARDEVEVDGKSIMGLLSLAAEPGAVIKLKADGEDEREAQEALTRLVENRFGLNEK
jgi:phosphocarrier protein